MESFDKYYISVVRLLTRRPRSVYEIREYLKKKKAPQDIIESVIEKIHEQKFQDDKEFALWWIDQRSKFRAKSDRVIKLELRQKGIDEAVISSLLDEKAEHISDAEKALRLGKKYAEKLQRLPYPEQYRKLGGYLTRRGFDWETVRLTIDACLERGYNSK